MARCRYPDDPEHSDDADDHLAFSAGERLRILEPITEDHYYLAESLLTGESGQVPGNFIGP